MLSVSVVVPVRNAAPTLPRCLAALGALDPAPDETILVDNGSSDAGPELMRAFVREGRGGRVRLVEEPRRGAAAARNAGIRVAKGDVVAFTDADCAPEAAWLGLLGRPFVEPAVGAVAGRVVAAEAASTVELFSALHTLRLPDRPARHRAWTPWEGGYPTANFAARSGLLAELGGFDEAVGIYGEDYDLCARLFARGAEIVYVPEARVAHHHRTTVAGMLRQAFGFGRSHPYLLRRHAPRGLWVELPRWPLAWRASPVPAWLDLAAADKKAIALLALAAAWRPALALLPLYVAWLAVAATRRARQAGVAVSPGAALGLAGLLLGKSAAMTAGRWWGSVKYGTLCF